MTPTENTLYVRLAGPMQSWGTASRLQIRRTDTIPSKSGVIGLLLCANGISRLQSEDEIARVRELRMAVRVDAPGILDWDYHTAGARIGMRSADGKIKKAASSGLPETLLSRRQYVHDASFLVALQGDPAVVAEYDSALRNPAWPVFLGRKCCIPSAPVFAGLGTYSTLADALKGVEWVPSRLGESPDEDTGWCELDAWIEHTPGLPVPDGAILVHDVPVRFGFNNHTARWIVPETVTAAVAQHTPCGTVTRRRIDYNSPQWRAIRQERLQNDHYLCVFCKASAEEVHHVYYGDVGHEDIKDLRSLCKTCHDACTMLEYGNNMEDRRVDPADPEQRPRVLAQIERLQKEVRLTRRRTLLQTVHPAAR